MKRRTRVQTSFFFLVIFLCLGPAALSAQQVSSELSLSRVVLYSSGVGYFEQTGRISGDGTVRLFFQPDQINDVLKSLVVRDFDGGSIGSVVYPGQDPLERTLESFALDLSGNPSLAQILGQLRGVGLRIGRTGGLEVRGTLVGIEQFYPPYAGDLRPSLQHRLSLRTARGIESAVLEEAAFVAIEDVRLNEELGSALAVLAGQTADQGRPVSVEFLGSGSRRVSVSYVSEAPVWKTSYRLDIGSGSTGKGLLQAWAIVENTSDNDWEDISLSLVSGSPVSFIQDLYTPIYVERPVIANQAADVVAPLAYDSAVPPSEPPSFARSAPAPSSAASGFGYPESEQALRFAEPSPAGVQASAGSSRAGELFSFTMTSPVSIPRRQSGMIPLVVQDIPVESVSIYTGRENSPHPMAGVRMTNETSSRLPAGPVTVYGSGIYAGDAILESWGEDEERIITYARDLDLLVSSRESQSRTINRFSISRGVLTIQRRVLSTKTFEVSNTGAREKSLLIEHPKSSRTLEPGVEPAESTADLYRFGLRVPARSTRPLEIRESQVLSETIGLVSSRTSSYLSYTSEGAMSAAMRQALQRAAELRQAIDVYDTEIADMNRQRSTAVSDQSRVRSNLTSVGRDSSQGQVFLARLLELENEITSLDDQIEEAREEQAAARQRFEDYVNSLNL